MVWASAPGYVVVTWTCGGVVGGYCAIGSTKMQMPPISSMSIATTVAKIGRSMKKLTMFAQLPLGWGLGGVSGAGFSGGWGPALGAASPGAPVPFASRAGP